MFFIYALIYEPEVLPVWFRMYFFAKSYGMGQPLGKMNKL